ncbi:MAG: hypothetical protein, partial [Olavius algarvensis Gamma 1 endosymbiont]
NNFEYASELGKDPVKELSTGIALIGPNFTHSNRLVPVDNSLIFINFMNRLRAKRTDSLTNRF